MKILRVTVIVVASLLLIGGAGYLYASSGVKSKPGYVKLVTPSGRSVSTILSLKIGPGGVGPVRWLVEQIAESSGHDQDMAGRVIISVLQELQGVQLHIYEVGDNRQVFDNAVTESIAALKQQRWQTLATVREDDEQVVVMQIGDEEQITGLSVMAITADTAAFINLIGPFDPATIATTASQMH